MEGKENWNRSRSPDNADFFTFGYSGRKIGEIVSALRRHDVRTVVDIRRNPVSVHRPEMSAKKFAEALREHGIAYSHAGELGVPREVRAKAGEAGALDVIWAWYDAHVSARFPDLRSLVGGFEGPAAFMCTELDPHECHRHRLALALERAGLSGFDL
jgi:uncharacterized protein (DUF488 family)